MLVSDMPQSYGIAPSMVHQVEVTQTVEIQTDDASIAEMDAMVYLNSQSDTAHKDSVSSEGVEVPDQYFGRAI